MFQIYQISLLFTIITISSFLLMLIINFSTVSNTYLFNFNIINFEVELLLDNYNIVLVLLLLILLPICFLYSNKGTIFSHVNLKFYLIIINILLILIFLTVNVLVFIALFESLLLPLLFFLGILGSRGRKINAVYLLFFFTLISSIFLFIGIFLLTGFDFGICFNELCQIEINENTKMIITYLFFIGFVSKIPMIPVHIWLPEAHVEASTIGSVILAALILKVGFYGLIRIFYNVNYFYFSTNFYHIYIVLSFISILYGGIIAFRQIDLKKIIAYSSIVHMNIGMLGIIVGSINGQIGSLFIMFSHGLISAAMFTAVGFIYERFHTRNIMYLSGLTQFMPFFSVFFFIIMISNMSLPGTCNFIGEFMVFCAFYEFFGIYISLILLIFTFFNGLFCFLIINKILFYQISGFINYNLRDLNEIEILIAFLYTFMIISFGILPNLVINLL